MMPYLNDKKLTEAINSLNEFSKAAWNISCDEKRAKATLLNFYEALKNQKSDNCVFLNCGGYYSFMINMIPYRQALDSKKYALACHELRTLCRYEYILQQRIYCNLMLLYREYLLE